MSGLRRVFWNIRESFLGTKFLQLAPVQFGKWIVVAGVPVTMLMTFQKGRYLL